MRFSYNWIQSYFDKKLPPAKKLAGLITEKSLEVEGVEKKKNDYILDINILQDRFADCSSHLGLTREVGAIVGQKISKKIPTFYIGEKSKIKLKEGKVLTKDKIKIDIKDKSACPLYVSRIIEGVKIAPSPKWIKKRLESCGVQPINNIVDAANFVMLEYGQPLHCFDLDKLNGNITVRWAEKGETIKTMDNQKIELTPQSLLIADEKNPLAIAGIKGGKIAEINKKTKNILIESAMFDPEMIRISSKKTGITTDASIRFSKVVNPLLTEISANRLAQLISELAGGNILKKPVIAGSKIKGFRKVLSFDLDKFEKFAGFKIPSIKIKIIFESLGLKVIKQEKKYTQVEIPFWRPDIERFENLAEEVMRMSGYNSAPTIAPFGILSPSKIDENNFWQKKIKKIVSSIGFDEVYSYSFVSENDLDNFGIPKRTAIELENPISSEYKYLRPNQIINLLKVSERNLRYFEDIKIFEIGKTFFNTIGENEKWRWSCLISNKKKTEKELFFELKGSLEKILEQLGIADIKFEELKGDAPWLNENLSAEILTDGESLGLIGTPSPSILEKYSDGIPASFLEIDFSSLVLLAEEEKEFTPPSKYPSVIRDISILVESRTLIADILNVIYEIGGNILRDVDLFDIYEDMDSKENKKSISFHLIFQSDDRTLRSSEVDDIVKKIVEGLEEKLGAEIR